MGPKIKDGKSKETGIQKKVKKKKKEKKRIKDQRKDKGINESETTRNNGPEINGSGTFQGKTILTKKKKNPFVTNAQIT